MGINFEGVNPELKAKLQNIVKDGKLTEEELKGLTAAEKEALAKAFGGELPPIGDNFITPSKVEAKAKNEEKPGFFKRAGNWLTKTTAGKAILAVVGAAVGTAAVAAVVSAIVAGSIATGGVAALLALVGLGLFASSCTKEVNINQNGEANVNVNIDYKNGKLDDIYQAILKQGETLDEMVKLLVQNNRDNKEIVDYLIRLNKSSDEIVALLKNAGKSLGDIFAIISDMQLEESKQTELITKIVNGNKEAGEYLDAILKAVKDGNKISEGNQKLLNEILEKMDGLKGGQEGVQESLNNVLALIKESIEANKEIGQNIKELINKVIEKIGDIKIEGGGTSDNKQVLAALDKITELLEKSIKQDKDIGDKTQSMLADLIDLVGKIGSKLDVDLSKLIEGVDKGNIKLDEIKTLIAELNKLVSDGNEANKVLGDKILKYLETFGYDMDSNFSAVINAINNIDASGGDTSALKDLLNKVLENQEKNMATQDKNTKAIIEAMGKIKLEAGDVNIDLSSIEDMLNKLLAQSKTNGDILTGIDAKLDAINITSKAILDKINKEAVKGDERYNKVYNLMQEIFNKLGASGVTYDDTKLLEILGKLSTMVEGKLNEILEAIKDHDVKVTVDVTGKVTCECDCGKNHEGIIGDLNDLMG